MEIRDFSIGTRVAVIVGSSLSPHIFPLYRMCFIDANQYGEPCIKCLTTANEVFCVTGTMAQLESLDMGLGVIITRQSMYSYADGTKVRLNKDSTIPTDADYGRFTEGQTYYLQRSPGPGRATAEYVIDDYGNQVTDLSHKLFWVIEYDPLCTYKEDDVFNPYTLGVHKPAYPTNFSGNNGRVTDKTVVSKKDSNEWQPDVPDPDVDLMKSIRDACNGKS